MKFPLLVDGCLGDFFAIESQLSLETKNQIDAIFYFGTKVRIYPKMKSLCSLCFPNMEKFQTFWSKSTSLNNRHRQKQELVQSTVHALPNSLNRTLNHVVYERQLPAVYKHSTFLATKLTNVSELPKFAFIHSRSNGRNFTQKEWHIIKLLLKNRNLTGIVFGTHDEPLLPSHCLSMIGKTTLFEAIEFLKKAEMFIGISSCFSILAAKIFSEEKLIIRTTNRNVYFNHLGSTFYSPHQRQGESFSFLYLNSLETKEYKLL
jgi:ADP-heptose:LPS heptosyltransferase